MTSIGLIVESLQRRPGTYLGALSRPIDAGDGELLDVVWICPHRHPSREHATTCAARELMAWRRLERAAARERAAAGWADDSDDPDSVNYRG